MNRVRAWIGMGIVLSVACVVLGGCASKPAPPPAALSPGLGPVAAASGVKLTPAQAAAAQRGMQQGPAIAAANQLQHGSSQTKNRQ